MKKQIKLVCLALMIVMSSCSLQKGYVVFNPQKDEILATKEIKDFMNTNRTPSIVLKTPNSGKQTTQADPNSFIYSAIEKELTISGFKVKDRGLLNDINDKSSEVDYQHVQKLAGVDLILEVIHIETNKKFSTNRILRKNGEEKIFGDGKILSDYTTVLKFGAVIEFKLVLVKNNEYGGRYLFYYTPCTPGNTDCNCIVAYKDSPDRMYSKKSFCTTSSTKIFEFIDQNIIEEFVQNSVKKMIQEIHN